MRLGMNIGMNNYYNINTNRIRTAKDENNLAGNNKTVSNNINKAADYEKVSSSVKTDFGGYDKNGKSTATSKSLSANSILSTKDGLVRIAKSNPTENINTGAARLLNTDEAGVDKLLKDNNLEREDLIDANKVTSLSDNPATKKELSDFAGKQREEIVNKTGMSSDELDSFLADARNKYSSIFNQYT